MIFTKNYTYHRIKKILHNDFNLQLERIYEYKGTRNGRPAKYRILDFTGNVVIPLATLDALRILLTSHDYPLTETD